MSARFCGIVPPYLLRSIADHGDDEDRQRALAALSLSVAPRRERAALTQLAGELVLPPRVKRRTVHDAEEGRMLPGRIARTEGERPVGDPSVDEAYEAAGKVYDYFRRVHDRRSLDDHGLGLRSTVHYGRGFSNAHWDGRQMIYGDGDGRYFHRFTASLDVVAHELTHGITQYVAGLGVSGQCGALAEHFSDVFGILVKQYWLGQSAAQSDWLIGADLFTDQVQGLGIRSMKAPGTAYDDPILGRDPQPAHMGRYVKTYGDDRGVHINSGIPNHAFFRAATNLGGQAWEIAGRIWYHALTRGGLGPRSQFRHVAEATVRAAAALHGAGSVPHDAVRAAWEAVGIPTGEAPVPRLVIRKRVRVQSERELFEPPDAAAELPYLG
ncbi:MAG: M4 family metallopeptidase [Acidobacteriota bacterium]